MSVNPRFLAPTVWCHKLAIADNEPGSILVTNQQDQVVELVNLTDWLTFLSNDGGENKRKPNEVRYVAFDDELSYDNFAALCQGSEKAVKLFYYARDDILNDKAGLPSSSKFDMSMDDELRMTIMSKTSGARYDQFSVFKSLLATMLGQQYTMFHNNIFRFQSHEW